MSHETRRRVILIGVALIVVALVLGSVGCSSTSANGDDPDALSPALYTQAMGDICDATTQRLDVLPVPPDEISSTPRLWSSLARSTIPDLSYTESRARTPRTYRPRPDFSRGADPHSRRCRRCHPTD